MRSEKSVWGGLISTNVHFGLPQGIWKETACVLCAVAAQ